METDENVKIRVVDATKEAENSDEEYDTYPPASPNFVYEDPYVTEQELAQISGKSNEIIKPKKPSSAYFYFMKHHRCIYQTQHPK